MAAEPDRSAVGARRPMGAGAEAANAWYARPWFIWLSFLGSAAVFLWPLVLQPNRVAFPPRSEFTDLLITHWPNAQYVRDGLVRHAQLPLWNGQILAGLPFAADPLAGLWYPANLLLNLPGLPLALAFNLLFVAHLGGAGAGVYHFLRDQDLGYWPALLGGMAFAGTPKLVAHIGAGHVSLVFAVAWTPWLLLAVRRAAVRGGVRRGAVAAACLAAIFIADVRWWFYAAALGATYWLYCWVERSPGRPFAHRGRDLLTFAVMFLALSAVLSLPLGEFILQSNRGMLTLDEAASFSLPPYPYLLGLVFPDLGGFHEWMTYVGVVPLVLALAAVRLRTAYWTVAALIAAAFSLGTHFILFPLLFRVVPGMALLRVPPRAWFVVALGVAVLAAHGLRYVSDLRARASGAVARRLPSARRLVPALVLLSLADLIRVDSTLVEARPVPSARPAAEWIAAQPGLFRVYSPSYSLPQGDGLQHVDGVNPLQLARAVELIERAAGVRSKGYSVTVPALEAGDTGTVEVATANAEARPDPALLGLLDVKYVAAEFPVDVPGLDLRQTFGRTRVYENTAYRARVWFVGEPEPSPQPAPTVLEWTPNRIVISARGPGTLVLSEIAYPGWQVRVDGRRAPLRVIESVLRGVDLEAGDHAVVFDFRPATVTVGVVTTAVGLAALAGLWLTGRRNAPSRP